MILAAGRGERMRPFSNALPKALLSAGDKPLIVWILENLAAAGFNEIIINHAHLGNLIESALGDGTRFGVHLAYSPEKEALETAGGIANALPLLGDKPFLVVNADIFCELDFKLLPPKLRSMTESGYLAHLVMVDNPEHHPQGDFGLTQGKVTLAGQQKLTYSGIGFYHPAFFASVACGTKARLAPLLHAHIEAGKVGGEHYHGLWLDVGTPERLHALDTLLRVKRAR
ncbi:MAG: N-acetylmuramate alpha-1-phosphate uridylyltransferase MurU [Burkholderiales bacterium]